MKYGPLFGICQKHRTPEALIENILQFEKAGAHGVVINFDELDREYWTFDHFKAILSAGAPHNVRAVCVAPGPVMTRKGMANMKTPLGRAAEPIEVVDFIMQLCSDRSSFLTGSTHFIDGGYLCSFGH